MKNKEIAAVFRRAADVLDWASEDESVYLNHRAVVLVPHDPIVGSVAFELHPRLTPVCDWERFKEFA